MDEVERLKRRVGFRSGTAEELGEGARWRSSLEKLAEELR
jgi:hypothetical protein